VHKVQIREKPGWVEEFPDDAASHLAVTYFTDELGGWRQHPKVELE